MTSAPVRVLITTGIFPPDVGGPATYVPAVAEYLRRSGHSVRVVTLSAPDADLGAHPPYDFLVERIGRARKFIPRTLAVVRTIVRHASWADVVLANGLHPEVALAMSVVRRPWIAKVVGDAAWERSVRRGWTSADFETFQREPQSRPAELQKTLRNGVLRQPTRVLAPSEYLRDVIKGWGIPSDRITVIPNAVADSANKHGRRAGDGPVRMLTVGRLVPWKRVDRAITALSHLPGATLTVLGDGTCRADWEALCVRLGLRERVNFMGQVSPHQVRAAMDEHDLFLLTSTYEGLPHVVVEAMKHGLPVVATAAGGTPEVVYDGETGFLVDQGDVALRERLSELIDNPDLRKRMGDRARAIADEKFSFEHMLRETEQLVLTTAYRA